MDYISRAALMGKLTSGDMQQKIKDLSGADAYNEFLTMVTATEKADVAPVRRGCWEGTADGYADGALVFDMWNCSECGFDADGAEEKPDWKFCPNCGARMDESGTQPQREDV